MVSKNFIKFISIFTLLITHISFAASAITVTASVDKNPVMITESLVLTVIADDDVDANSLDTSPLLHDFIVGRTSVSSQTSMINFTTTRTTRWTTVLIARTPGTVIIPALTVSNQKTAPITVEVLAADKGQTDYQQDIFITSEISSQDVYVQQLLTLTVKLHFSTELKQGSLSDPKLEGANIVQIGKDQENEGIINGKRYRIIERVYAITPQKSGEFILSSPLFSGEVMLPSARRSNFLSYGETKPVSVVGKDINLTIQPIPVSYHGHWLPTELLTLHQEWQPDLSTFKVGEPITRTITLTAAGLSKEQLPKFDINVPKGLKIYPDQAVLNSTMNRSRLVSQQVQSFAIVASKVGTYELPEISIPWFNIITNKVEQAIVPAQQIVVQANGELDNGSHVNKAQNLTTNPLEQSTQLTAQPEANTIIVNQSSWLEWLYLALWLLTSLAWLLSIIYQKSKKPSAKLTKSLEMNTDVYLALIAACKQNQAHNVLPLIVPWIDSLTPTSITIATIDDAIHFVEDEKFSDELDLLQQFLYGKNQDHSLWQGSSLLTTILKIHKSKLSQQSKISTKTSSMLLNP